MEVAMSDLTPDDEALLERARRGGGATAEDHARIKRELFTRIGIGASTISTSVAGAGLPAAASAAGTGLVASAKIVIALAIAAGAGTGAFVAYGSRNAHEPHRPLAAPAMTIEPEQSAPGREIEKTLPDDVQVLPSPVTDMRPVSKASALAPRPIPERPAPAATMTATPTATATPTPMATPITVAPALPLPPAAPATVGAEADLLREADRERKAGYPARALALLHEHATKFPNGILIEEREAERVVVLCALGRTEDARAAASLFLRERLRSPLSRRVQESCGGR
jgi:hypothetical protein